MTVVDKAAATPTLNSLTGLRWIAAFGVFGYHTLGMGYFGGAAQQAMFHVFLAGATGVSLFFVLSGFVLVWSHSEGVSSTGFWRRRLARIYPLHVVALAMALVLAATIVPSIRTDNPFAVVANLFLISAWYAPWSNAGNPVSWTLVCEAFFYLMFPFIVFVVRRMTRGLLVVATFAFLFLVLAMPYLLAPFRALSPNSWPIARIPEFVVGMLLAQLIRTGAWRGPGLFIAIIAVICGYVLALIYPSSHFALTGFTIIGFALIVAGLARADIENRWSILATRPLILLGTLSFAFYLVHLLALQAIGAFFPKGMPAPQALGVMLLALGVGLAIAWALHSWVEKPGRRLIIGRQRSAVR